MVKSDICWMSEAERGGCDFDNGGYFIIKGAEKAFIAQEQICLKRLWFSSDPYWKVAYRSESRRRNVFVKLVQNPKAENIRGEKVLRVYALMVEVPIWILFFALGVKSDKEVVELIDCGTDDGRINNIMFASDADEYCVGPDGFRVFGKAFECLDKGIRECKFPPTESSKEFIAANLFPSLSSPKRKALFLGYMVKCLLEGFSGMRKCDNNDDFRNKRLELLDDLLERELRVHMRHAEKIMVKATQRDLYGDESWNQSTIIWMHRLSQMDLQELFLPGHSLIPLGEATESRAWWLISGEPTHYKLHAVCEKAISKFRTQEKSEMLDIRIHLIGESYAIFLPRIVNIAVL